MQGKKISILCLFLLDLLKFTKKRQRKPLISTAVNFDICIYLYCTPMYDAGFTTFPYFLTSKWR